MLKKLQLSPMRRFMLWFFGSPANDPYVTTNVEFAFANALQFLEHYNKQAVNKISIHHFLLKVIADTLAKHPRMNVKIFGDDIYQLPEVTIASPVNLITDKWNPKDSELGMAVIRNLENKNFEDIAGELSTVRKDYRDKGSFYFLEEIAKICVRLFPNFSIRFLLRGVSVLSHNRYLYRLWEDVLATSTVVTNMGAVAPSKPGIRYRSVAFTPPDKMLYLSVCFGAGPVEERVIAENDQIVIQKTITMLIIFDHRVVDGFLMHRFIEDLGERILNPGKYYGNRNSERQTDGA